MKIQKLGMLSSTGTPTLWFLFALAFVMLAMWVPFIPNWQTFIHMWRVEIAASVMLVCTLAYHFLRSGKKDIRFNDDEWKFIVLPIVVFIFWSGLSAFWAASWKSAIHHTLIWTEYLIFYTIFRQMIERRRDLRLLLTVLVLTLLVYSVPAIFEYCGFLIFGGAPMFGMRFAKYGEQIVTILPLVILGVIRMRGNKLAVGAAAVGLLWLLVFCSVGRANYLLFAGVIACMFAGVVIIKRYRQYAFRFAILVVLLVVIPVPLHVFSLFAPSSGAPAVLTRFSDADGVTSSNNFRKLMISLSAEMIRDNPVVGIGADNFGMQVNKYRQAYGAANPADVNLANAEDQIPSHAHNEFLQVTAELGLVGAAIMAWLLFGLAVLAFRSLQRMRKGSLYPVAAVLGLGVFLLSSLVSSYSFRVMQNGIVFFFVLAVASRLLFTHKVASESEVSPARAMNPRLRFQLACAAGIVACLGLITYTGFRVCSVIVTARANQTRFMVDAIPLYELAMDLDTENPDARNNLGMRLFRRQRYAEAVPYLETAVQMGRGPSAELSYLSTAKSMSGDNTGAESTMKAGAEMYPRSAFVLTRYATLLESHGKTIESALIFDRALDIDRRAASTWRAVIVSGPKELSEMAARDASYMHVMELKPERSIYAVVTERYLKHPEEQRFSLLKVTVEDE